MPALPLNSIVPGLALTGLALLAGSVAAQPTTAAVPPPQNVLNLSASASVEVPKDWLSITLSTTREGPDGATVQAQLKAALEAALSLARPAARPGQVELRTGGFAIGPRYGAKATLASWQGSAELILEGRDLAALSALAGRVQTLSVSRVSSSLSREAREKVESEVAAQAIARFRSQAQAVASQFGFAGYAIREVTLHGGGGDGPVPMPRMSALAAAADSALPLETGRATVTSSVSGSVQMTR